MLRIALVRPPHRPRASGRRAWGCDGLRQEDQSLDILYERGVDQTIFDGDWKAQKLSRADYEAKLRDTESHYSRTLALLIESLRPTAGGA